MRHEIATMMGKSNGRMISRIFSQLEPNTYPPRANPVDQMNEPMNVNATKGNKCILVTPAGRLIKLRATGTNLDMNTAHVPYFSNHLSATRKSFLDIRK